VTRVIDASVLVAAVVDVGPTGRWAESMLSGEPLAAPHLMPVEAANVLRRSAAAGLISADAANLAHVDLTALRVELFPYGPLAERVWSLRHNLTSYDAWYVALAESLDADLVTLDHRLGAAPGPICRIVSAP
jgi:predicted nucleic acid-binding protein